MTTDLVTWLRQQLDEDERAVIAYRDQHPGQPCVNYEGQDPADYDEYDSCARHIDVFKATPYRDVEFGLREVDAKRQFLDRVEFVRSHGPARDSVRAMDMTTGALAALMDVVKFLALPYADRPGYDERWRP